MRNGLYIHTSKKIRQAERTDMVEDRAGWCANAIFQVRFI